MQRTAILLLGLLSISVGQLPLPLSWGLSATDDPKNAEIDTRTKSWDVVDIGQPVAQEYLTDSGAVLWYRVKVFLTKDMEKAAKKAQGLMLNLGHMDGADVCYWNGQKVGTTGHMPPHTLLSSEVRRYIIPYEQIRWNFDNHIALRVFVPARGKGMYSGDYGLRVATLADRLHSHITFDDPAGIYPYQEDTVQVHLSVGGVTAPQRLSASYRIHRSNGELVYQKSERITLNPEIDYKQHFDWVPDTTGFYVCIMEVTDGSFVYQDSSYFAIAPQLLPTQHDRPPSFSSFWSQSMRELNGLEAKPVYYKEERQSGLLATMYRVELESHSGKLCGWLSVPTDRDSVDYEATIVYADYGQAAQPIYGARRAIVLSIGRCEEALDSAALSRGFLQSDTNPLRSRYLDAVFAAQYLAKQKGVQGIHVTGKGFGGTQALVVAALLPTTKSATVMNPWLAQADSSILQAGYPLQTLADLAKQKGKEAVLEVFRYYDLCAFAPKVRCTTDMLMNMKADPAASYTAFQLIGGKKALHAYYAAEGAIPQALMAQLRRFYLE